MGIDGGSVHCWQVFNIDTFIPGLTEEERRIGKHTSLSKGPAKETTAESHYAQITSE
ncbi:hypothetical protein [uncultured Neglectibacter sp.]|uniref:hypothetical protein n=1 Tax=uncultured Neglectibacter sp. TaxID=1924108 RepID=UPI0034DF9CA8